MLDEEAITNLLKYSLEYGYDEMELGKSNFHYWAKDIYDLLVRWKLLKEND